MTDSTRKSKASSNFVVLKSLLPIVQDTYTKSAIDKKKKQQETIYSNRNNNKSSTNEKSIQCELIKPRLELRLASWLPMPSGAVFVESSTRKLTEPRVDERIRIVVAASNRRARKSSVVYFKEIGVQTYELEEANVNETLVEDLASLFMQQAMHPKSFMRILQRLSSESIARILKYSFSSPNRLELCQKLILLSDERIESLERFLTKKEIVDPNEWLMQQEEESQTEARWPRSERRVEVLKRFRKIVRMVILNLGWFKALNKDYSKRKYHETLLHEFYDHEDQLSDRLLQQTFNKDDFRAPRVPKILLKDMVRHVLMKEPHLRSRVECDTVAPLVASVARLNELPKQTWPHLARLLRLSVYEKGRVVVRNRKPLYFYYIVSGACDVLTMNKRMNGMIKTDDLQAGEVFGKMVERPSMSQRLRLRRNPLQLIKNDDDDDDEEEENKKENEEDEDEDEKKTIVVNPMVELLVVDPNEINELLERTKQSQKELIKKFISNWLPAKLWNWTDTNFEKFSESAELVEFDEAEIIYTNTAATSMEQNNIFMVYDGRVDMIKQIVMDDRLIDATKRRRRRPLVCDDAKNRIEPTMSSSNLYKVCSFYEYAYFGFETRAHINTWFMAAADSGGAYQSTRTRVIRISPSRFSDVHEHARWLLDQMIDDYEQSVPSIGDLQRRLMNRNRKTN